MKIRQINIENFRGIRSLEWQMPDRNVLCLIGKGDSTKSTILQAIKYVLYPYWNLGFNDYDFYLCDINEPIIIKIVLGKLDKYFLNIDIDGLFLHGWNKETLTLSDEPNEGLEEVIIIRLQVDENFEPVWKIIGKSSEECKPISYKDRAKVLMNSIDTYNDRQLAWGRGSLLTQLTEIKNINTTLADVARTAKNALSEKRDTALKTFDDTSNKAEIIARTLGVPVNTHYHANLDLNSFNVNLGGISIHDGDIPLRHLGMGSRRMLLCGLQRETLEESSHITLFDEVEIGLEPYRISRLLKHIKDDEAGQYFISTHSPTVLRELSIDDLYIVHNREGEIKIMPTDNKSLTKLNIQGKIRSGAEAFLSKKIIVCEGQTEVGFCRGLDNYWVENEKSPFSFQGVAILNSSGASNVKDFASALKELLYDVAVMVDSDAPDNFSFEDKKELEEKDIKVIMWDEEVSLEGRVFLDLPWTYVLESVNLAKDKFGNPVIDQVNSKLGKGITFEDWEDSIELRIAIGKASKKGSWFKSVTKGELWLEKISPALNNPICAEKDLVKKINDLRIWIDHA